jgi:hypothetical protein
MAERTVAGTGRQAEPPHQGVAADGFHGVDVVPHRRLQHLLLAAAALAREIRSLEWKKA